MVRWASVGKDQRKFLADKLAGTANIIFGALAISQFITDRPFQTWLFLAGVAIYIGLLAVGLILLKGGDGSEPN